MSILSAALLLFLVIDPLGNIPFFMTTLKNVDPKRHKRIILRELLIALVVLIVFLFIGQYILKIFQISDPSLSIAGGIILFLIAIKMIFPGRDGGIEEKIEEEPLVVPLAIPFVAGPSALATVLIIISREPDRWLEWLFALLLAWFFSGLILYFSSGFNQFLGKRGLIALERLMGMILTAVAIQILMTGITEFLKIC